MFYSVSMILKSAIILTDVKALPFVCSDNLQTETNWLLTCALTLGHVDHTYVCESSTLLNRMKLFDHAMCWNPRNCLTEVELDVQEPV